MEFAINHMTAPRLSWRALLDLASELGCAGVEFRNDLDKPLFSGDAPETVRDVVARKNLRIVGLSQVYPFNSWSDDIRDQVANLIDIAKACGAETISLIPRNDGTNTGEQGTAGKPTPRLERNPTHAGRSQDDRTCRAARIRAVVVAVQIRSHRDH